MNYEDFIKNYYKLSTYVSSYSPKFQPIPHEDYWITPVMPVLHPDPSLLRKPGRSKSSRYHNEMDWREPSSQIMTLNPRPIDSNVLYDQSFHRSSIVWDDRTVGELDCIRREAVVQRNIPLHRKILPILQVSRFYGVARLGFIQLDWYLITALIERWRPETHTFHMPTRECIITLQDIEVLLGIPVDGEPVISQVHEDWINLCQMLLGVVPPANKIKGSKLNLTWLASQFPGLDDDVEEEIVIRYARAYILQLMGGSLFYDKSGSFVHLMFLPLLGDLHEAGRYSWGGACLAWLYRQLCKASKRDVHDIVGPLILLQIWAWERFPTIAPQLTHANDHLLPGRALGSRSNNARLRDVANDPQQVLDICNNNERYMEEIHNMYDLPIVPPLAHRGCVRVEEVELDEVYHNVEEVPPTTQT
ncbi:serine/threonine-protein phosphatase 7 long form-like protein [Cucumis melo var. makuwa]|uniref:Serine/threonine-protein phosphatase 7 long form-like protein n=1 Tax=Cucumis melo var. makuwa TaxID=1194695 RepID=A0A5D3BTN9_CUCMM|nr:serine/threonine-protein phosphatase 7 long form-like protein [Cucumis melo var. makuwa]